LKLPFNVEKVWGTRARVSVKGTMNGFAFRSSIFPTGDGSHHLMTNKAMLAGAQAKPGDTVAMVLEPDTEPRTVELPADFKRALAKAKKAKEIFEKLAPSHKKRYVDWITEAKKAETRAARVEKALAMLRAGQRRD
jgi:UDP-N-acetylmuramate-alanine ligase